MLSNKWTFSLTYLVMLIAVGFAMGLIVTPDASSTIPAESPRCRGFSRWR